MTFIIVDIEATCDRDNPNWLRENMEPIEIGAVAVNDAGIVIGEFSTFIRPEMFPKLSNFCKGLTTITQDQVDNAEVFKVAYQKFEKWALSFEKPKFCSWGGYDSRELNRQCKKRNMKFNFKEVLNLKELFAKSQSLQKEIGVGNALIKAKLNFEGTPHRGIDDAKNIAKLLKYSYYGEKVPEDNTPVEKHKFKNKP